MKELHSIKSIDKIYNTGEEPVLVACNDHNSYICKYSRYSGSANKLVCELMGAVFAKQWMLNTPEIAIVKIKREHIPYNMSGSFFSKPILGSLQQPNVVDITPATTPLIYPSDKLCLQLIQIALFDLWLSNEDRNANNANLMYDMVKDNIIAIDYGCCFNTATFDYPLSLLTESESILCSDLFRHLIGNTSNKCIRQMADVLLNVDFPSYIDECKKGLGVAQRDEKANKELCCDFIPSAWNIDRNRLSNKIEELLGEEWIARVKNGFTEILNTALE